MSKVNKSKGNMYDWVTHTWSPMIGCPHQCSYCYVKTYQDLPVAPQLNGSFPNLGSGRTMFVGHMCDMFAANFVDEEDNARIVDQILEHCSKFDNTYVFQTKNPAGLSPFRNSIFPQKFILGTTIETNRADILKSISNAPDPDRRAEWLPHIKDLGLVPLQTFITIEPILDFDVEEFADLIVKAQPTFVNIGADSKGHGLIEPSFEKVMALVEKLNAAGVEIRKKLNLDRLMKQEGKND